MSTSTQIEITYNDEFDREHYPITDHCRAMVEKVADRFRARDGKWYFEATIHSMIFTAEKSPFHFCGSRFNMDDLEFFAAMKADGLRWIEGSEGRLSFSVEHGR